MSLMELQHTAEFSEDESNPGVYHKEPSRDKNKRRGFSNRMKNLLRKQAHTLQELEEIDQNIESFGQ